jgi:predicted aldo/keto reductase-like oxidoreductase
MGERRDPATHSAGAEARRGIDRRELLRRGALAGLGAGLLPLAAVARAPEAPRVRRRVRLGRTGLEVSDIGFGTSRLRGDVGLVHHALDRGIDYFDTAESYTGGRAEETLGRALEGRRDAVVLASKAQAGASARREQLMLGLEGSLRRLRTDRIDVYFNHAVNDVARLENPEWWEFLDRARQAGKIRFTGMSGHGGRLVECLEHALEADRVDVVLVAFNFGQDPRLWERFTQGLDFVARQPDLPRALKRARERDVAVVAMKTLLGARLNDLRDFETAGSSFGQAALRWALAWPDTDAAVVTMSGPEQVDEYLGASGWQRPRQGDGALLRAYLARNGALQCRQACRACEGVCPHDVPIADVLRARMYAEDYGDAALGRETYAGLERPADACLGCAVRSCASACPHGLPLAELTARAHRVLAGAAAQSAEGVSTT